MEGKRAARPRPPGSSAVSGLRPRPSSRPPFPSYSVISPGAFEAGKQANVFPRCKKEEQKTNSEESGAASFVSLASPLETAQSPLRCEKLHRFREEGDSGME